ncbi:MAG: S1 family peptidase [Alphaproteobacteria bacterium]|nr:S1 family peptidase [Alphaproteobacteria bacterium]
MIIQHSNDGSFGSGVLIDSNTVLTAAHVVRAEQGFKQAMVNFAQIGTEFDTSEPFRMIDKVIVHPNHQMNQDYYCEGVDLAILKFSEPILDIAPVKLYSAAIKDNTQGYIVGYGAGGKSNIGKTDDAHIRGMGTTRISKSEGNYLAYNFDPLLHQPNMVPSTFKVTQTTDKLQSLPSGRDSGGPFLLGKGSDLSVAGIAHGGSVFYDQETDSIPGATFKWIAIKPHLEWIRANM